MKAKSKVLLGLLVALAMMVLAVPAFAQSQTTTFSVTLNPSKDEGLVVYQGNTGKINVAITDTEANADADDVYTVVAEDKFTGDKIPFDQDGMTLNGEAPSGNLKVPTVAGATTAAPGKHPIQITVTKTAGKGQGAQTISNYIVEVKENVGAKLSTENLDEVEVVEGLNVYKRALNTGDSAEISVTREKGSESDYTYQWQIAKAGEDEKTIAAAAYDDPTDKVFEDIAGETGATLQKTVDIDDNGKYVRCIVTDGAGNRAIASAELEDKTIVCCVRLDVTDENLVCAKPTEDQNVSVIMNQTKGLQIEAKAGTKPYTFKWFKDGVEVTAGDPFLADGAAVDKPTLNIKGDADKSAEGDFVCEIEDAHHQKVKSPVFHVTVADMPKLTLDPSVVSQKAEYSKTGEPVLGNGDTFIATADADKPLTLTANIENPADVKSIQWLTNATPDDEDTWKSEKQGADTTFTVAAPVNGMGVRAIVEFNDIPGKLLQYTTKVYVTDGSLSGNVYTYIGNDADKAEKDPTYTVTLPAGVYWLGTQVGNLKVNDVLAVSDEEENAFDINLPPTTVMEKGYQAVVTEAATAGQRTLSFKLEPGNESEYPQDVLTPYVKNMTVKIPAGFLTDKHDGSAPTETANLQDVVLPVSDGVGYKIVRTTAAADLTLKKKVTNYNTKEQPAEVIGKDDAKIGEVSEVRYMLLSDALDKKYVEETEEGSGQYKMKNLDAANKKAFLAALTSDAPVDANKEIAEDVFDAYIVVCNIAASDELEAATDVLVPDPYTIKGANNNAVEKDPTTFFDWTKQKVYNGEDQEADVKFVDGMEKKGKISKITYKTVDSKGALVTVQPNAVGTYRIYVSTTKDEEEVDSQQNVGDLDEAYIGDFEITKLPVTADLFKMDPTEADYTGNPIVPEITTETPGVGEIEAVHYYAEGSEEELGSAPVKAGVYTVKIDVKEGENYRAEKGVEVGTLTIKSQETNKPTLYMRGHVQNKGWDAELTEVKPGSETMIGTTGSALRVEAIDIVVPEGYTVGGFAHVENEGDVTVREVPADAVDYPAGVPEGYKVYRFGSTGKGQRLEAIQTEIKDASGALLEGLSYQVHVENKAWMGYVANGSFAGTRALGLRLEALRFAYEGTPAPTEPEAPAEETPATPETPAETPETPAE